MYVKSLENVPSPFMVGDSPFKSFFMKIGITAAYGPLGSCFG